MDFLQLSDQPFLIFGVANKKSVAYHIARILENAGAKLFLSVQNNEIKEKVQKLFTNSPVFTCDVGNEKELISLKKQILATGVQKLKGIVHSLAFANFSEGIKPFHETLKDDFLGAFDISCYSLINISNTFKDILQNTASVVTISISSTTMTAENYGYMAPIKAALDSSVCFLAKSFSNFSSIRFNAVGASLLKTSASAGIPGYLDSYLYAEKLTLRKQALTTEEVANTAVFLLSDRSSGINAQKIIVDAGMGTNYFDRDVVKGNKI